MKTTLMSRQMIANPRRTTLAHISELADLGELRTVEAPAPAPAQDALPQRTANPRRTVLNELPAVTVTP